MCCHANVPFILRQGLDITLAGFELVIVLPQRSLAPQPLLVASLKVHFALFFCDSLLTYLPSHFHPTCFFFFVCLFVRLFSVMEFPWVLSASALFSDFCSIHGIFVEHACFLIIIM